MDLCGLLFPHEQLVPLVVVVALLRLFASADDGGSSTLSHLVGIYVERSSLLWKAPDALELLWQVWINPVCDRCGLTQSVTGVD